MAAITGYNKFEISCEENMANEEQPSVGKLPFFIPTDISEVVKVAILGVIIGLLVPAVSFLIATYIVEPVFCRSADSFGICATGGNFAFNISTVLFAMIAVAMLAQQRVFRPLLIAIAAAVALWGIKKYLDPVQDNAIEYYAWFAGLYAAAYLAFYWLLRIRNFAISLMLVVAVVVGVRLVLQL